MRSPDKRRDLSEYEFFVKKRKVKLWSGVCLQLTAQINGTAEFISASFREDLNNAFRGIIRTGKQKIGFSVFLLFQSLIATENGSIPDLHGCRKCRILSGTESVDLHGCGKCRIPARSRTDFVPRELLTHQRLLRDISWQCAIFTQLWNFEYH